MRHHLVPPPAFAAACLLGALALAAVAPRAVAQATFNPPESMTYQGFLTDGDGVALGKDAPKNYDIIFRIYNHENNAGAALLWAEQQTVTVDGGYFSVLLGEGASTGEPRPALSTLFKGPTASDRFMGITVKGIGIGGANVDILPRLRLQSAPYAFLAQNAVRLVQDTGADLITSSGNAVTVSGTVAATSFSGSGAGLSSLNANNIVGTLPDALLSGRVVLRNVANTFSANQTFDDTVVFRGPVGVQGSIPIEFGRGYTKEQSAGQIGYGTHSGGAGGSLDIVGAGSNGNNRRVTIWSEGRMQVHGGVNVSGGIFARGGYPGGGGANNGYAFSGNGGDNDSGMFSDIDGHVRFTSNDQLKFSVYPSGVYVHNSNLGVDGTAALNGNHQQFYRWGIRLLREDDSSRYVDWVRYANYFSFFMYGGNTHNSGTREVRYDGDGNWDFYSDRRLKKDIVDAEPMLDRAMKIQIRRYRWKEEDVQAKHKLGVIAQELQPLFPDLVSEGEDRETKEVLYSVGYSDLGMIAVKALQEFKAKQDAEVGALKSETAELKAQVADLKSQVAEMIRLNAELRTRLDQGTETAVARR